MKCPECQKEFDKANQVIFHRVTKHGYRKQRPQEAIAQPDEQPVELPLPQEPQAPESSRTSTDFNATIEQIIPALSPLIEQAVVQTLNSLQLSEAIDRKILDVQARLSSEIQTLLEPLRNPGQMPSTLPMPPSGDTKPQNTQLRDSVIGALINKFLSSSSGISGGSDLAKITETLKAVETISSLANRPYREGRLHALQETNEMIKLMRGVGAKPKETAEILGKLAEGEIREATGES